MLVSYALAAFFVLAAAASIRLLPSLHPLQLWTLVWSLATALYCLRLLPYEALGWPVALVAVVATVAFGAGGLFGQRLCARFAPSRSDPPPTGVVEAAAGGAALLTAVLALAFLVEAAFSYGLRGALFSTNEARSAVIEGKVSLTFVYLYPAFATAVLAPIAAFRSAERRRIWLVVTALAVGSIYLSTARGLLFLGLSSAVVAVALAHGPIPKRRLLAGTAAVAATTLAVLVLFANLQGRTLERSSSLGPVPSVFRDEPALSQLGPPYQYLTSPLPALDDQVAVSSAFGRAHGCATFRVVCSALGEIGLPLEPEPVGRPYTTQPLSWNTYTALDMPLIDGGLVFFPLLVGLMGTAAGLLFEAARRGILAGLVGYPLIASATLFATWQNVFFEQLLLGAGILALVFVWVSERLLQRINGVATS